ncbi:hypothetical protein P7C73_g3765, partial [Tremellales sp. Uapishka_1]
MANASSKRIASSNETALKNLQLGLIVVNLLYPLLRLLLSLVTSRSFLSTFFPSTLYVLSTGATVFIWRWFVLLGTPKRDINGNVKSGEDLGGKGIIELAWDFIYMTWICTIGSALFGNWMWWLFLLVPGFGAYKAFTIARPLLGMVLPSVFGPRAPKTTAGGAAAAEAEKEPAESRKQAKLRARMEKGDKRIQQVQRK